MPVPQSLMLSRLEGLSFIQHKGLKRNERLTVRASALKAAETVRQLLMVLEGLEISS